MKLTSEIKDRIINKVTEYGTGADTLRCLALATVDNPVNLRKEDLTQSGCFIKYEQNMTFVGVVGIIDPPRPSVKPAIEMCAEAGFELLLLLVIIRIPRRQFAEKLESSGRMRTRQDCPIPDGILMI